MGQRNNLIEFTNPHPAKQRWNASEPRKDDIRRDEHLVAFDAADATIARSSRLGRAITLLVTFGARAPQPGTCAAVTES